VAIHSLTAELFVRNLTNEDDFTWRGIGGNVSGAVLPDFGYRLRPRTAGVQLSYTFE
jgi:outer membrane receptor protein involved in Fe transport